MKQKQKRKEAKNNRRKETRREVKQIKHTTGSMLKKQLDNRNINKTQ